MWHNKAHRHLGRKHSHRMATLRALSTALFERERIRTTLMKAKELRPFAEKLITKSKRDDLHARRLVLRHIQDRTVAKKLFDTLSARYMDRNGGYTRILKLGRRQGDGAEMALVELIGSEPTFKKKEEQKKPEKKGGLARRLMGGKGKKAEAAAADESSASAQGAEGEETSTPGGSRKTRTSQRHDRGPGPKTSGARPTTKSPKGAKKS